MLPLPVRFRELRGKRHWPLFDRDGLDASQLRSLLSWHIDRCLSGDYSFKYVLSNRKRVYRVHTVGLKLAYTVFMIFVLRVISVHAWNGVWRFYFEQSLRFCAWLKPPFGDPSLNPRSRASPGLNMRYARSKPYGSPTVRPTRLSFFLSGRGDHSAPIKI